MRIITLLNRKGKAIDISCMYDEGRHIHADGLVKRCCSLIARSDQARISRFQYAFEHSPLVCVMESHNTVQNSVMQMDGGCSNPTDCSLRLAPQDINMCNYRYVHSHNVGYMMHYIIIYTLYMQRISLFGDGDPSDNRYKHKKPTSNTRTCTTTPSLPVKL